MENRDMWEIQSQLPTRWLETDNPDKVLALDKSGLKPYMVKAESIKPVLDRVWHLVEEFWENFKFGCSTVSGYRISVEQHDIFRATGLPNTGRTVGYWFENKKSKVEQMGKKVWNARHAMRLKQLCGVETSFKHEFPVNMIKDDTLRYLISLVMEHLSGMPTVSHCNHGFLEAIEQGMNGNVTNWSVHISKRMKCLKVVRGNAIISHTKETQNGFRYGVVTALLVREQAPDLWQQVVENGGDDVELLKKRRMNEINGVQDIELFRERRMNEINENGFELGNLKGDRKIESGKEEYGEKRRKLSLALVGFKEEGSEDSQGVQMQVERKERMNSLNYQDVGVVLQMIKVWLAEECAETAEQYLADRERWMSVQEVSDGELLEQYYSDLTFRSGDHILDHRMHGIPLSQSRIFSRWVELEQRKRMKERAAGEHDKLLVISIEYILAHFVHKSKVPFAHGNLYVDPYIVFVHPQACRFLWSCLSVFKVVLWSEKPRKVHDLVLQHILGGTEISDGILSYSIEDCVMTRISRQGDEFYGCYKDLTRVWEDLGDYGSANTILVDTSNVAMLRNQDGNVICPIPYKYQLQASHWQLETYLLPYLECLESVQSIPEFVKKFPFPLQKGHTCEWSPFEEGGITTLFTSSFPPCRHGIVKTWKVFPSIVTETSGSQLELFNTQCSGINHTGQQFPITRTSISFSQSVPPAANLGSFEMYNGNSSRVFLGFNDHTPLSYEFCFSETMGRKDMEELQPYVLPQQPTRWLETDNPDKLRALDKSGLKPYIVKAESIRQVLGQVGDFVEEFWLNFEISCSTVFGYRISVEQEDIFRATGLPNEGRMLGYWFENKNFVVKQIGKEVWKARHAKRLKNLCGVVDTRFIHELPVDMIKDDTTRYVASLVMEHLSGISNVSHCNYGFLDAIEEGMNGNVTNWSAHITKKIRSVQKVYRKTLISGTKETQYGSFYGVVIALLVKEQAPDLWQQVVENGGCDVELLKKRKWNEINGLQDMELLKKRRVNEINGMHDIELLKMGNLIGEGKIEDEQGDQYGEKWQKLSWALVDLDEGKIDDNEGVQMQGEVERKKGGMNGLDSQTAGAVLRRMKAKLADKCAETVEQYLADCKGWEASVREVSDGELLKQYYSDLGFHSGDHVVGNRMQGIPKGPARRFSGRPESEQRKMMKEIRMRKYDKLLVISIEYVLAHFVHKSKVPFAHGGLYVDPYIVFVHPQACRFLWACFSVFKVVLWSEKPREVHDFVLQHILGGSISGQILSYSIEDCIMTRISRGGNAAHGCFKDLTRVWEDIGDYGSANTLLIDTSNVARLRNQDGNVICPIPYQYHVQASHWQLETYLLPYLDCLQSVQGVPEFVKNFPFRLEKGHTWERSQLEEGRVIPLFATPCPPHHHGIVNNWNMFPSIVTETSNSQLHLLNIQCLGISNTGQQFPITGTSISFLPSVPPAANFGIFEMYHGISSRLFLGFSDHIQSYNNINYMRELMKPSVDNMKYMTELSRGKVDLHNMACEKEKLEKELQEKEHHLQKVVDGLRKVNEEKKKTEEKNADLSKAFVERGRALKRVKLEKNLAMKQREIIICSLQETVQALQEKLGSFEKKQREFLQEKLGSFEKKQREFQINVKREVEKESAQIRTTLTTVPGLKQEEYPVFGAQKLIKEPRQQSEVKHQLKPDQFMLVISPDSQQSTVEPYQQISKKGTSSHITGDESTRDRSHLLLTSDTEALHCSICMEEWTTAGDHRICSLACGHMFGMSCIREWLQLHENNIGKCPQCNNKAELGDIRILFVPVIAVTVRQ